MNAKRIAELESEGFCWEIRGGAGSTKLRQAPSVPTSTIPSDPPSLPNASLPLPSGIAATNGNASTITASTSEKAGNKNGTTVDKRDDSPPVASV